MIFIRCVSLNICPFPQKKKRRKKKRPKERLFLHLLDPTPLPPRLWEPRGEGRRGSFPKCKIYIIYIYIYIHLFISMVCACMYILRTYIYICVCVYVCLSFIQPPIKLFIIILFFFFCICPPFKFFYFSPLFFPLSPAKKYTTSIYLFIIFGPTFHTHPHFLSLSLYST